MRWFRRRPAEPPRPAPATEPEPVVLDVEPAAETTATIAREPVPEPEPAASPGPVPPESAVAPARNAAVTVPETAKSELPELRHWHRAGNGMRLPSARVESATRPNGERVDSGGWHRA